MDFLDGGSTARTQLKLGGIIKVISNIQTNGKVTNVPGWVRIVRYGMNE